MSKKVINFMKDMVFDDVAKRTGLLNRYENIHNYYWGMSNGFVYSDIITKKEWKDFGKWLWNICVIKIVNKQNTGTFFYPKYEDVEKYNWRIL